MNSLIQSIKDLLSDRGLYEGEDYRVSGGADNSVVFEIPVGDPPADFLPEVLRPYAIDDEELERMIFKGNTDRQTTAGASFEVALSNYMHSIVNEDPAVMSIETILENPDAVIDFAEYESARQAAWDRALLNPEVKRLEEMLSKLY